MTDTALVTHHCQGCGLRLRAVASGFCEPAGNQIHSPLGSCPGCGTSWLTRPPTRHASLPPAPATRRTSTPAPAVPASPALVPDGNARVRCSRGAFRVAPPTRRVYFIELDDVCARLIDRHGDEARRLVEQLRRLAHDRLWSPGKPVSTFAIKPTPGREAQILADALDAVRWHAQVAS